MANGLGIPRPHLHISVMHSWVTLLEILMILIPLKIIAAKFQGRSPLAAAVFNVL